MGSITYNKGNQIKRTLNSIIGISNWESLSIKHDNINHQLDTTLLKVINEIIYKQDVNDRSNTTITTPVNSNNEDDVATVLKKEIEHSSISNNGSSNRQNYYNDLPKDINSIKKKLQVITQQLKSLKKVFEEEVEEIEEGEILTNNSNNIDSDNIEYNPTITFKLGKEFVLGNLFIDQIIVFLEYLYSIALEIETNLQYWERIEPSLYYFQKTPLFWLKYYHQQLNNRIQFSSKFNQIHNLTEPKSVEFLSKCLNKINNFILPKTDQQQPIQETTVHPPSPPKQTQEKIKKEIKHPKLELTNKIEKLKSYQVVVSVIIGRLTYLFDTIKANSRNATLESFNELMSKSNIIIFDSLLLLNQSFNRNDNEFKEFEKSNKLFKEIIDNTSNKQLLNFKLLLNNQFIIENKITRKVEKQIIDKLKIPNYLTRNWFKISIGSIIIFFGIKYSYDNFDSFKKSAFDTRDALIRFYHEHLEEPLLNIWNVIRYDKKTLQLADPVSLQSSIDSLGRMVIDYNIDKNIIPSNSSNSIKEMLMELASRGDISSIMKSYESNIRSPIQNILFGDMIRLILIQVQKEKVDVDKAMVAIDKLLQANELNFQLLAAIPSGIFLCLVIWQFKRLFTNQKKTLPYSQTVIFTTLRKINRTLILNNNNNNQLPNFISPLLLTSNLNIINYSTVFNFDQQSSTSSSTLPTLSPKQLVLTQFKPFEKYGTILMSTNKLRSHQKFVRETTESQWFNQDIHDLESDYLSNQDKIQTINRMFQTYSFLKNFK